jgi:hypothetical protein
MIRRSEKITNDSPKICLVVLTISNGAYNIIRKVIPQAFAEVHAEELAGFVKTPVVIADVTHLRKTV